MSSYESPKVPPPKEGAPATRRYVWSKDGNTIYDRIELRKTLRGLVGLPKEPIDPNAEPTFKEIDEQKRLKDLRDKIGGSGE